jgi:hypothetical protein
MPRSRFDELIALAEDNDGLVTAEQARQAGFTDSVLTRLAQRGKIERMARAVYRLPFFRPGRFAQCREAVLWATANRGPKTVAISHDTALAVYGISDANPHQTHIAVPKSSRLRRSRPKGVVIHHEDITPRDITVHEGIPLTTISRTVGPSLDHPYSTKIVSSRHPEMRELRVQSGGDPYRVFYAFDPRRTAILLLGGNKDGDDHWYKKFVRWADRLYDESSCSAKEGTPWREIDRWLRHSRFCKRR